MLRCYKAHALLCMIIVHVVNSQGRYALQALIISLRILSPPEAFGDEVNGEPVLDEYGDTVAGCTAPLLVEQINAKLPPEVTRDTSSTPHTRRDLQA